ncbi:MAG: type 2 isopentenyl-diphosphate Delta-isomerase, partial [Bdellovibrionales bacterium]
MTKKNKNNFEEDPQAFESRKKDHIRISMDPLSQSKGSSDLDSIQLIHDSFPEMDLDEISIHQEFNSLQTSNPFFVAAMTAGNKEAGSINYNIAKACNTSGWIMMVGSQRRELFDSEEGASWKEVYSEFPDVKRFGNIGLTQIKQA